MAKIRLEWVVGNVHSRADCLRAFLEKAFGCFLLLTVRVGVVLLLVVAVVSAVALVLLVVVLVAVAALVGNLAVETFLGERLGFLLLAVE